MRSSKRKSVSLIGLVPWPVGSSMYDYEQQGQRGSGLIKKTYGFIAKLILTQNSTRSILSRYKFACISTKDSVIHRQEGYSSF